MNKYKFFKALYEDEIERKIEKFQKEHYIISVQFSTCPYNNELLHSVYYCAMIEYRNKNLE